MSNGLSTGDMAGQAGGDFVRIPRFILEDSPQLAKKIADFEDLQRKAQEAAAILGDINEIEGIKAQTKQAAEQADVELAKQKELTEHARVECERLISEATAAASRKVSDADIVAKGLTEAAAEKSAAANSAVAAVESDKRANEARAGELDGRESSLQQKADALASREQELKGEFEKLAEVRGLIDNVLA